MLLIAQTELACRSTTAEGPALYWRLADVIWVVLFARPYLPGR